MRASCLETVRRRGRGLSGEPGLGASQSSVHGGLGGLGLDCRAATAGAPPEQRAGRRLSCFSPPREKFPPDYNVLWADSEACSYPLPRPGCSPAAWGAPQPPPREVRLVHSELAAGYKRARPQVRSPARPWTPPHLGQGYTGRWGVASWPPSPAGARRPGRLRGETGKWLRARARCQPRPASLRAAAPHDAPTTPPSPSRGPQGPRTSSLPWVEAPGRPLPPRVGRLHCWLFPANTALVVTVPPAPLGMALDGRGTRSRAGHRQPLLGSLLGPPGLLSNSLRKAPPTLPRLQLSLTVVLGLSGKKAQWPPGSLLVLRAGVLCPPLPGGLGDAGAGAVGTALVGVGHLQDPGQGRHGASGVCGPPGSRRGLHCHTRPPGRRERPGRPAARGSTSTPRPRRCPREASGSGSGVPAPILLLSSPEVCVPAGQDGGDGQGERRAGRHGSCPLSLGHARPLAASLFLGLPLFLPSPQLPWEHLSLGGKPGPHLSFGKLSLEKGWDRAGFPLSLRCIRPPRPARGSVVSRFSVRSLGQWTVRVTGGQWGCRGQVPSEHVASKPGTERGEQQDGRWRRTSLSEQGAHGGPVTHRHSPLPSTRSLASSSAAGAVPGNAMPPVRGDTAPVPVPSRWPCLPGGCLPIAAAPCLSDGAGAWAGAGQSGGGAERAAAARGDCRPLRGQRT